MFKPIQVKLGKYMGKHPLGVAGVLSGAFIATLAVAIMTTIALAPQLKTLAKRDVKPVTEADKKRAEKLLLGSYIVSAVTAVVLGSLFVVGGVKTKDVSFF